MPPPRDARAVLGLPPDASAAAVRRAFRRLVLELHPDRHQGDARHAARLRTVVDAYEELTGRAPSPRPRRKAPTRASASPEPTSCPPRARDRFACPRCLDTWSHDSPCPRCDVPLVDELRSGPVRPIEDPQVDAMLAALEHRAITPHWADRVAPRVPMATISSLLAGGALALPIHAPIAAMLLAYGLFLFGVEALGTSGARAQRMRYTSCP